MSASAPFASVAAAGPDLGQRILQHKVHAFRAGMHGPNVVRENGHIRLITGAPLPFGNFALVSRPDDLDEITRAVEFLCACGAPAAVILPGTPCAPVDSFLRSRGFALQDPLPAMALEIDRLHPTALPSGCEFVRVHGREDCQAWTEAFAVGYELPAIVAEAFAPRPEMQDHKAGVSMEYYAIRKAGRIVATSMLCKHDGLAGVYCVATIPEERGNGLGAYVTAEPLRKAYTEGYRVGVLQSTAAGYGVYRRLGFMDLAAVSLFVRLPG